MQRPPPRSALFPYTTLFRSHHFGSPSGGSGGEARLPPRRHGGESESLSQAAVRCSARHAGLRARGDRKSTRLNSSHSQKSYAVFCFKTKNQSTLHENSI